MQFREKQKYVLHILLNPLNEKINRIKNPIPSAGLLVINWEKLS
jgi:hypothetical protein